MIMFPLMETVRSGADLENVGGSGKYSKEIVCPDGCVIFKLSAKKLGNEILYGQVFRLDLIDSVFDLKSSSMLYDPFQIDAWVGGV